MSILHGAKLVRCAGSYIFQQARRCSLKVGNHYEVLGILRTASKKEIRTAFLQLSKKYHPDARPDLAGDTEQFNKISEAYKVLSSEGRRAEYDYTLLRMDNPNLPHGEHVMAQFYRDGTIYTGPHKKRENVFTNLQVALIVALLSIVGALVQAVRVRNHALRRAESDDSIHEDGLQNLEKVRSKAFLGRAQLQLLLAERKLALSRKVSKNTESTETLVDRAPTSSSSTDYGGQRRSSETMVDKAPTAPE